MLDLVGMEHINTCASSRHPPIRAALLHGSIASTRMLATAGLPPHLARGAVQKLIETLRTSEEILLAVLHPRFLSSSRYRLCLAMRVLQHPCAPTGAEPATSGLRWQRRARL